MLHATSDAVHHRSVLTVAGDGTAIVRAAVALAGLAAERIDLRLHRGVHPASGRSMSCRSFRCATLRSTMPPGSRTGPATRFGSATQSSFYYGAARAQRREHAAPTVRRGQFEGLDARLDPQWYPDAGNVAKHESAGAIAIGARDVLVAFNVELDSDDERAARAIARTLRERDGGLGGLRALAFRMDDGRMQVSFNVTNVRSLALYRIVELVRRLAARRGIAVTRGELIGCLPRGAVEAFRGVLFRSYISVKRVIATLLAVLGCSLLGAGPRPRKAARATPASTNARCRTASK